MWREDEKGLKDLQDLVNTSGVDKQVDSYVREGRNKGRNIGEEVKGREEKREREGGREQRERE